MLPLFRDEAVRHATARLEGEVLLPARISTWLIGAVLLAALALAVWFAATSPYARRETVSGWLAPESGVVEARATHGGVLAELLVDKGDQVLAGAPLARIQMSSEAAATAPLARLNLEGEYTITSSIDGRVDALLARAGQILAAGSSVVVLAPAGDELVAELFVPACAIGLVNAGETIKLQYEAFPVQHFGSQGATVETVSLTVLAPDEAGLLGTPGARSSEPVFSARARLAAQTVQADGASLPLRSGMRFSADVVIARRTLMEWLLEPLAVGR